MSSRPEPPDEAVIVQAVVAPGHDARAELVLRVRYPNGAVGPVTLDATCAQRLLERCRVDSIEGLCGQPWRRLLDLLPVEPPSHG